VFFVLVLVADAILFAGVLVARVAYPGVAIVWLASIAASAPVDLLSRSLLLLRRRRSRLPWLPVVLGNSECGEVDVAASFCTERRGWRRVDEDADADIDGDDADADDEEEHEDVVTCPSPREWHRSFSSDGGLVTAANRDDSGEEVLSCGRRRRHRHPPSEKNALPNKRDVGMMMRFGQQHARLLLRSSALLSGRARCVNEKTGALPRRLSI